MSTDKEGLLHARSGLPPLAGLEAFVIAARSDSFTQAGKALGLSPSALSRRIKLVEDHWGATLFHRGGTFVHLTLAGNAYLAAAERAIGVLHDISAEARRYSETTVAIAAPPMFVRHFISPYLRRFKQTHPRINLVIERSSRLVDLHEEDVDLVIRYGTGGWRGLETERIFVTCGGPVCAPRLQDGRPPPRSIEALADHTLLHFSEEPETWPQVFKTLGREGLRGRANLYFDDAEMLFEAALQGSGVALAASEFIRPLLHSGMLVRSPDVGLGTGIGFFFVFGPGRRSRPAVRFFCDWLLCLEPVQELRRKQERYGF